MYLQHHEIERADLARPAEKANASGLPGTDAIIVWGVITAIIRHALAFRIRVAPSRIRVAPSRIRVVPSRIRVVPSRIWVVPSLYSSVTVR